VTSKSFGKLADGREVDLFILKNKSGAEVRLTNLGAAIVSIVVPDRGGSFGDVILGHDAPQGYVADHSYLGFIVGRYGNRIGKGKFSLNGKVYQLGINDGEHHLHGGVNGFHRKLWNVPASTDSSVSMRWISPDGDEGYPGKVTLDVTYTWNDNNELVIDYKGTSDAPTILNPTSHGYFNLTADPRNTILDHELLIEADRFTPSGSGSIPTGKIEKVEGTPFDFRAWRKIGERIDAPFEQLQLAKGYDHNFVLNRYDKAIHRAAAVYEPKGGRLMEVFTDQPGIQFYSGNYLDGSIKGKGGIAYQRRSALCLEAQHFPDSPNQPQFPSVVLHPSETYRQTTTYRFSVKK